MVLIGVAGQFPKFCIVVVVRILIVRGQADVWFMRAGSESGVIAGVELRECIFRRVSGAYLVEDLDERVVLLAINMF